MKVGEKVDLRIWNDYQANSSWRHFFPLGAGTQEFRFFKLEQKEKHTLLSFHVPAKKQKDSLNYIMLFDQKKIQILTNTEREREILQTHLDNIPAENFNIPVFLCNWLQSFSEKESFVIENAEREITALEDEILNNKIRNFNAKILEHKKLISRYCHYYHQLASFTVALKKVLDIKFNPKDTADFESYIERIDRLIDETQTVREYILDVQEVYQAEIEIRQNDIMKYLTIITTLFFPLSLIAGWYGMNFKHMPELKSSYGYPIVIGVSLLIIAVFLIIFRKKKFF